MITQILKSNTNNELRQIFRGADEIYVKKYGKGKKDE